MNSSVQSLYHDIEDTFDSIQTLCILRDIGKVKPITKDMMRLADPRGILGEAMPQAFALENYAVASKQQTAIALEGIGDTVKKAIAWIVAQLARIGKWIKDTWTKAFSHLKAQAKSLTGIVKSVVSGKSTFKGGDGTVVVLTREQLSVYEPVLLTILKEGESGIYDDLGGDIATYESKLYAHLSRIVSPVMKVQVGPDYAFSQKDIKPNLLPQPVSKDMILEELSSKIDIPVNRMADILISAKGQIGKYLADEESRATKLEDLFKGNEDKYSDAVEKCKIRMHFMYRQIGIIDEIRKIIEKGIQGYITLSQRDTPLGKHKEWHKE